ncbi:MAG: HIT family protein [Pseudomonadota bacterium]
MVPERFRIHETEHWLINHRMDSTLPGYLVLGAKGSEKELTELPREALTSIGPLLAASQQALVKVLRPKRVYFGRFGHMPGFPFHFHIIPIFNWIERLYLKGAEYYLPNRTAEERAQEEPDGADLTLFVSRAFCESRNPPAIEGPSVARVIAELRKELQKAAL